MIDKSRKPADAPRDPLPPFLPVPRQTSRHDGWTPERQTAFIEALADTGSVKAAAHAVNMTPEGAYLLRRHPEGADFRKAWERALKLGVQRLEDVAMDRALNGVEIPVYHFGAVVGTRRVYNDRLLMFLLRNRAAKRFQADNWQQQADAVTRQQLEKLKAQWRKEWEEERRAKGERESREAIEGINRKLETMRQRRLAGTPPKAREHWHAYERAMGEELTEFPEWEPDFDPEEADDVAGDEAEWTELDEAAAAPAGPEPAETRSEPSEDPSAPRLISPKDAGWRFGRDANDGRCTPL